MEWAKEFWNFGRDVLKVKKKKKEKKKEFSLKSKIKSKALNLEKAILRIYLYILHVCVYMSVCIYVDILICMCAWLNRSVYK